MSSESKKRKLVDQPKRPSDRKTPRPKPTNVVPPLPVQEFPPVAVADAETDQPTNAPQRVVSATLPTSVTPRSAQRELSPVHISTNPILERDVLAQHFEISMRTTMQLFEMREQTKQQNEQMRDPLLQTRKVGNPIFDSHKGIKLKRSNETVLQAIEELKQREYSNFYRDSQAYNGTQYVVKYFVLQQNKQQEPGAAKVVHDFGKPATPHYNELFLREYLPQHNEKPCENGSRCRRFTCHAKYPRHHYDANALVFTASQVSYPFIHDASNDQHATASASKRSTTKASSKHQAHRIARPFVAYKTPSGKQLALCLMCERDRVTHAALLNCEQNIHAAQTLNQFVEQDYDSNAYLENVSLTNSGHIHIGVVGTFVQYSEDHYTPADFSALLGVDEPVFGFKEGNFH